MINRISNLVSKIRDLVLFPGSFRMANDELKLLIGIEQAGAIIGLTAYQSLEELELRIFSQFGDDGIIQYLAHNLELNNKTFVEFGVEDYSESNTRFLLQKDNWSGFVMDGSSKNIARLQKAPYYWRHDLKAQAVFVTKENINSILSDGIAGFDELDVLHIDIDGNDYWVWKEIEITPAVVIMEYNSNFGIDRSITVPYDPEFYRTNAHFSNLYWGCSLKAIYLLAMDKGYQFIGCNSAGNNAYFVRNDKMNDAVRSVSLEVGYVRSKYREARDELGALTFANAKERDEILRGLPVFDIETQMEVPF